MEASAQRDGRRGRFSQRFAAILPEFATPITGRAVTASMHIAPGAAVLTASSAATTPRPGVARLDSANSWGNVAPARLATASKAPDTGFDYQPGEGHVHGKDLSLLRQLLARRALRDRAEALSCTPPALSRATASGTAATTRTFRESAAWRRRRRPPDPNLNWPERTPHTARTQKTVSTILRIELLLKKKWMHRGGCAI
jgi:hypothetical protein